MKNAKKQVLCKDKTKSPILSKPTSYTSPTRSLKLRSKSGGTDNKNCSVQKELVNTFQGFVHQMDELFLVLKAKERLTSDGYSPEYTHYHDICDKLRQEMLIAIDKLEITSAMTKTYNEKSMEFLHKMNNLTYQLTDIRSQYHRAIKDFDMENNKDEVGQNMSNNLKTK